MSNVAKTFAEFLLSCEEYANKTAFRTIDDRGQELATWTYQRLLNRSAAVCQYTHEHNLVGKNVILAYPTCLEFIAAFLGCLMSGTVAVPVSPPRRNRGRTTLDGIFESSQPAAVLSTRAQLELLNAYDAGAKQALPVFDVPSFDTDSLEDVEFKALVVDHPLPANPDALAFLQYTSGSTTSPRGVCISHRNLMANSRIIKSAFGNRPDSRGVFWLPNFHDMGLIGGLLQTIFTYGSSTLISPATFLQKPICWLRAISDDRATVSGGPNFAYERAIDKATDENCEGLDLSSWEVAFTGAEPIQSSTLERFASKFAKYGFRETAFYPCYGLAEATLMVSGGDRESAIKTIDVDRSALTQNKVVRSSTLSAATKRIVGCGTQLHKQRFTIVDPETADEKTDLELGEIWVRGASVADGYYNNSEKTRETFHAWTTEDDGPFLRTGDLGFLCDGELYVTGRLKEMILIRGENYYPEDIELTVDGCHTALRAGYAAAFAINNERDLEELVVVLELDLRARTFDYSAIVASIRTAISRAQELSVERIVLVRAGGIPQTSSGKTQRTVCRSAYLAGELEVSHEWRLTDEKPSEKISVTALPKQRTTTEIEDWLILHLQQRVRGLTRPLTPNTQFAELGLDSINAVEIADELSQWSGQKLSPTIVYQYPTIEELALWLGTQQAAAHAADGRRDSTPDRSEEPIAIIGIGCRFPGNVDHAEDFWKLLVNGIDAITEVPRDRWDIDELYDSDPQTPGKIGTRYGGFVDNALDFDADFFNISPREAIRVDPQQRVLLEVAWQALEHAAIRPSTLAGTRTGVFIGAIYNDYALRQLCRIEDIDIFNGTGGSHSIVANRLSYLLDTRGPSVTLDTACSSSLVTTHLACKSLREGESDVALSGAVNLILGPEISVILTKAQMLSPDGRCRAFDANANGYVRSEGCGVLVLKRLSDAVAAKDPIYGVIRGTSVNHVGRSNGLSAPNGPAQEEAIATALSNAKIPANQIGYVECHGTGTKLGDPIELEAIKNAYCSTPRPSPLIVGSVKTNIGHTEAAAGVAGLIKAALVLDYAAVPPHLHLQTPNPILHLDDGRIEIPKSLTDTPRISYAGVSSFGFGGTNAHAILESPAQYRALSTSTAEHSQLHTVVLSARTESALRELASVHARYLKENSSSSHLTLCNVARTLNTGRETFANRLAITVKSLGELVFQLEQFSSGQPSSQVAQATIARNFQPKTAFLFTGQGSQYFGMGRQLFEGNAVFRNAFDQCDQSISRYLGVHIRDVLFTGDETRVHSTAYTQPALFALQFALVEVLRSWSIYPNAVMGHSVGEFAAAVASGVLNLDDAARLIVERGRSMQALPPTGKMVAVLASRELVCETASHFPDISVAAFNGPNNIVLSGSTDAIDAIVSTFKSQDIRCNQLHTSHAFHSQLIAPAISSINAVAANCEFNTPSIPILSNLTGAFADHVTYARPSYWGEHARNAVKFEDGIQLLVDSGFNTFIEVGPNPVLIGMAMRCTERQSQMQWIPLMKAGTDELQSLSTATCRLALVYAGDHADRQNDCPESHRVALPHYRFQRTRYFSGETLIERLSLGHKPTSDSQQTGANALLGVKLDLPIKNSIYETWLRSKSSTHAALLATPTGDLLRPSALLCILLGISTRETGKSNVQLANISFAPPIAISNNARRLQIVFDGSGRNSHVQILARQIDSKPNTPFFELASATVGNTLSIPETEHSPHSFSSGDDDFADALAAVDQLVPDSIRVNRSEFGLDLYCDLQPLEQIESLDTVLHHLALTEQVIAIICESLSKSAARPYWSSVEHAQWDSSLSPVRLQINVKRLSQNLFDVTVRILDSENRDCVCMVGLSVALKSSDWYDQLCAPVPREWLRSLEWKPQELQTEISDDEFKEQGNWLLIDVPHSMATALATECELHGGTCHVLDSPADFSLAVDAYKDILQRRNIRKIVFGGGLKLSTSPVEPTFDMIETMGWRPLLALANMLEQTTATELPRVYVVTQHAQWVDEFAAEAQGINSVSQAPLIGLSRVIANEIFRSRCTVLDVEDFNSAESLKHLVLEIMQAAEEDHVAWRQNRRFVARLDASRIDVQSELLSELNGIVHNNATYIVTGGMGGLGGYVLDWLVQRGATSVVLISRSQPTEATRNKIDAHALRNIHVHPMVADVSNVDSLRDVFRTITVSMPPIKGIFHLAGVLDDGLLRFQSPERFRRVLDAKAVGARNLHQLSQGLDLDHFVLFSSIAAIIGSPAQSNYAAANAYLDSLAQYRRAHGLAGTSINWGSWSKVGMAAKLSATDHERWSASGLGMIDQLQGMMAMEQILLSGSAHVSVMPIQWDKFCKRLPHQVLPSWVKDIDREHSRPLHSANQPIPQLIAALDKVPESERHIEILSHISKIAQHVLASETSHLPDPHRPLSELGFDSLTGVELCTAVGTSIGQTLMPTILFDHPTLASLAEHVHTRLFGTGLEYQVKTELKAKDSHENLAPSTPAVEESIPNLALGHTPIHSPCDKTKLITEIEQMKDDDIDEYVLSRLTILSDNKGVAL